MPKKLKKSPALPARTIGYHAGYSDYKSKYFDWAINTKYLYTERNCPSNCYNRKYDLLIDTELLNILEKMDSYRTWLWRKIETSNNGTSCGMMEIAKLDERKIIVDYLSHIGRQYDVIYKIEINNHHRVWGIRIDDCLYLIWNDPDHSFYKHKNKNYTKPKSI